MKIKLLLFFLFLAAITVIASCYRGKNYNPDSEIVTALKSRYPQASRVKWEARQGYLVAEFRQDGTEIEAWFDNSGKWLMTGNHIKYDALPLHVREQFERSDHSGWKKENIEKIERADMTTIYIIETENNEQETDLYYNENGSLIKTVHGGSQDYSPLSEIIKAEINRLYPEASIIEFEDNNDKVMIDIQDDGKAKEILFIGNDWSSTSWDILKTEVPNPVMEAFRRSAYEKYRIDNIKFYETPVNSYYYFDLEQNGNDAKLSIAPDGNTLP